MSCLNLFKGDLDEYISENLPNSRAFSLFLFSNRNSVSQVPLAIDAEAQTDIGQTNAQLQRTNCPALTVVRKEDTTPMIIVQASKLSGRRTTRRKLSQ